ncbi:hypothetical protein A20C1_08889 [marine actinobacterium PHSC20C1]|nr:hypothetical protein A20C1_08889 [marine actinobacterium PHSC20C1]
MSSEITDRARLQASLDGISHSLKTDAAGTVMRPWVSAHLERDTVAVSEFEQYGNAYEFRADEAINRGGHASAPSPMRYLLSSIAFCVLGWCAKSWAAADEPLFALEARVRTELDMRGEHRVDDAVPHPPWFVIEIIVEDKTAADVAITLAHDAIERCPVSSLMAAAVPVYLMLRQRGELIHDTRPEALRAEDREELTR